MLKHLISANVKTQWPKKAPNTEVYYAVQASKQALLCYTSKGDSLVELAGSQQRDAIIWQLVISQLKLYLPIANLYFAEMNKLELTESTPAQK